MKNNRKVPIKNILYMFSYIWDKAEEIDLTLRDNNDDFDSPNILAKLFIENVKDICSQISDYDIVLVAYENESKNKLKNELEKEKVRGLEFTLID